MMNTTVRHTRFRSQSRKTALAAGLSVLFLFYFVGGSLFTHAHRFNNAIVVHSHYYAHPWQTPVHAAPFDAAAAGTQAARTAATGTTATHSHSAEQFQTIQHLDYLIFTIAAIGLVCTAFRRASSLFPPRLCVRPTATRPHFTTRGPPVMA